MAYRVLVVEDEPDLATLLEIILGRAGYEVTLAHDGEGAIERAIDDHPDAILLDVTLPTIDGYEVLQRIRRDHRTLLVPVILLTGRSHPDDIAYGWHLEPDDYIVKPFDPENLLIRLGVHIRRNKAVLSSSWAALPGGATIEAEIRARIGNGDDFALLHVDLDNFKSFNDRYGFVRGNRAIELLARILRSVATDLAAGAFAGHVGGDDFAMIVPPALAEKTAREIIGRFDRAVAGVYDVQDATAGFIEVDGRTGERIRSPVMSVSIGIATTDVRRYAHFAEMARVASEMKSVAKAQPGSSYAIDRRSF